MCVRYCFFYTHASALAHACARSAADWLLRHRLSARCTREGVEAAAGAALAVVVADDDGTGTGSIDECDEDNNELVLEDLCSDD